MTITVNSMPVPREFGSIADLPQLLESMDSDCFGYPNSPGNLTLHELETCTGIALEDQTSIPIGAIEVSGNFGMSADYSMLTLPQKLDFWRFMRTVVREHPTIDYGVVEGPARPTPGARTPRAHVAEDFVFTEDLQGSLEDATTDQIVALQNLQVELQSRMTSDPKFDALREFCDSLSGLDLEEQQKVYATMLRIIPEDSATTGDTSFYSRLMWSLSASFPDLPKQIGIDKTVSPERVFCWEPGKN